MTERAVPPEARRIAARLLDLFHRDRELALALNDAARRLQDAGDRLTAGLSAEALQAIYGPAGPDLGLSGRRPAVLADEQPIAALERVAHEIRAAFADYQRHADERRILAADVGEATAELIAAMRTGGFGEDEARRADVQALTAGGFRPIQDAP